MRAKTLRAPNTSCWSVVVRIAFDASSMRGEKTGIGVYTENLIQALRRFAPDIEMVELDDGATAHQRTDRRMVREQIGLPRLARQSHADVLHLTGFAAPIRAPMPVILTVMDLIGVLFAANFPPVARFYWSRYLPFTLRFPAQLITLSEHTRQDIVRLTRIPAARVRVISPGRDERFHPIEDARVLNQARAEIGLPAQFILFVGTLEPRKGVDTLIAAFAQVANVVDEDLVIVGKRGWYWQNFFDLVRENGLETRVRFLEYVADEKMPLVYNLARAFVFPSRYEGFGLPPLEAMACGTPVVSSNAASLPEVVGSAGLLLSPGDVDGLARAIVQVVNDSNLRIELRERGLQQAHKFSWARAAHDILAVYHQVWNQQAHANHL
jgi:glycosyltransferase involved in cell wall biosynthesis